MGMVNKKMKRTVIAVLTLALMWMFLLPVQAFAEDSVGGDSMPVVADVGDGGGTIEAPVVEQAGGSGSAAAVPAGSAYLAPSIESAATGSSAPEGGTPAGGTPEGGTPEGGTPEDGTPTGGTPEGDTPEGSTPEGDTPEGSTSEGGTPEGITPEGGPVGFGLDNGGATGTTSNGEMTRYDNNESANAIQQAVDAAIQAGQNYITVVVQDGTYTGGLNIDNSGSDESIVVNIVAHDAYVHPEAEGDSAPDAVYPVPTNRDGTVDTSAITTNSAGGVKLEGGVSIKNVELLLAGIYLTLKEQQENQEAVASASGEEGSQEAAEPADTDPGNVDIKVENAGNFTYYGTSQDDTVNITLTDVENTIIDSGAGDDVLDINTTMSPNVELDKFAGAASSNSNISVSSGAGNDKITVTETSTVTNNGNVVSVRKGQNTLEVDAGDGTDTITLKGGSSLVDIKKNISEEIAKEVYRIVSMSVSGHGSEAKIKGGAGDDLLNLDTSFELGTLGKTTVDYQGGSGKNRLHLTGTLAPVSDRVKGELNANGSGYINMHSENTISRTDYSLTNTDLWFNKTVTDLKLQSPNALNIQMTGVDSLTDDLSGKNTVNVAIETVNGQNYLVTEENGEHTAVQTLLPFTDYVYTLAAGQTLPNITNVTGTGLLSKLIIKGQHLKVNDGTVISLPGVTLMLESLNGAHESGSILIAGKIEADSIMLKLASTDTFGVSFLEKEADSEAGVNPSIMDVNTSATVTIAATAELIATRVVDILAKSIQVNGLLPDLGALKASGKLEEFIQKGLGFNALDTLKQAASINFISIKMASVLVDILGSIAANTVRVSASTNVDTTATNSALRDVGLPFALSVILGEAGIKVSGDNASITANGDIYLDATSDIKVNTTALSGRLPFTVAVTVVDNEAYVDISGGTLRSTNGNIVANATGTVNMKTAATGSNIRPNGGNQTSGGTQVEMGKSGGFFAISVLNQDVFSALRGAANAIAGGNINVNSTAKATLVNNAASNPGEDGESMTLVKLIQMLTRDEKLPGDGGIVGKIVNKITSRYTPKENQTLSKEEQKQKEKKTSALGGFLNKLTGNDSKGDDVSSLVNQATSSTNSGKTSSVQLVGALAVTYADNNNKAYIDTTGTVTAGGKLSVLANGEMKVETLADGSPIKADDPAAGKDEQTGPQDQHYDAHKHGIVKVDALTNGTILIGAAVGDDGDGIYKVENYNPDIKIKDPTPFNFVVKACLGYKLKADENGKYWITNAYKQDSTGSNKTEEIEVEFLGKDADGCYIYKGSNVQVFNGENLFKAEFVPKHSLTAENNGELGKVEFSTAQTDGQTLYYADHEEMVYVTVNVKPGVTFTKPVITYISDTYGNAQPFDDKDLELLDKDGNVIKDKLSNVIETIGDEQNDGTVNYYYRFKMPNGKVTMVVKYTGKDVVIGLDNNNPTGANVWFASEGEETAGNAMTTYEGEVGDKVKVVIQLAQDAYLVKNSLKIAGKNIHDIVYDGNGQYTCLVNIPAIFKADNAADTAPDMVLSFSSTKTANEAQLTEKDTSTSLGAGLAVDVTRYDNQAYIAENNTVTAGSVEVKADTADLSASAVSKAGFVAGDVGVAGAITVHLVSANNQAYIAGNVNLTDSNVNLTGGNLVVDSTIKNSNIVTKAEAAGDGADGKNTDPDSVGVGAGIAVGVTNLVVASRILENAVIGGKVNDLNINASHTGTESMTATAGAAGGTSVVPVLGLNISGVSVLAEALSGQKFTLLGNALINAANSITRNITADAAAVGGGVGVGASFIIDILNDSAKAKLGRNTNTGGNLTVTADSVSRLKATAKSGAKGSVSGEDAGDGGSEGGGNNSTEEPPPSGGSDNSDELPDDYYDGLDSLFGEGNADSETGSDQPTGDSTVTETVADPVGNDQDEDDPESLAPLFRESEADAFVDSNKNSAAGLAALVDIKDKDDNKKSAGNVNSGNVSNAFENRQKAETSEGSVQVAATMVLNIQNNTALAQIGDVGSVEAGGKITVTSKHDTDGVIMADASATNSSTGVGVAVAINTVTYSNVAEILANQITAAELIVRASVYEEEAKKEAEGFLEAVKKDLFGDEGKLTAFINGVLQASGEGNLNTFIRETLADLDIKLEDDTAISEIVKLICQWVEELIQGRNPSFPSEELEEEGEEQPVDIKTQAVQYAKEIFKKAKQVFTNENLRKHLFGGNGILATLKQEIKDLNLREKATSALVSYLAGKLGGNEEAEGVGPRISTSAVSGAGASNVGVAGSVAISVVNGESKAYIADATNGEMKVENGNITVESKASQDVHTSAGSSVDALGRVDKNKDDTDNANSTQGDASDKDVGKSVGVGAAVAMSFADLSSDAGIGSGWKITAKDLLMDSQAENNVETTSVSGTDPLARTEDPTDKNEEEKEEDKEKPGENKETKDKEAAGNNAVSGTDAEQKAEEEQKAAKAMDYAVDASVAVTLIQNTVRAYLAQNSVITLGGNLNMLSSQSGETNTNASGHAMGNATAVGAAVAINLAFSDVLTQILGSGSVAGTASLDSKTENQDDATAVALAMGAEMERYFAKLRNAEKVKAFNKKKDNENKDEDGDGKVDGKIENDTANKVSSQLKRASNVSDKEDEDKSDPSQPLSVQAIKSQNVKTESTNQTESTGQTGSTDQNEPEGQTESENKTGTVGSIVKEATDNNTGDAVDSTLAGQTQEGQSIHVAASVGVNVTQHSAKTEIGGKLTVGGLKADVENTSNFSTASTGAAISEATNSNCVGAAVAVSVNGNKAQIVIPNGVQIVVTGKPASDKENADSILGNVALTTVLNQNSTSDGLGRYGALAVAGSSSGKGGKVGLAGSIAVMVAKGTSAILMGNNVKIDGHKDGTVSIQATDKSKLSAAAMAATKSDGSTVGVGASFALLYAKNAVLAEAGDNFQVSAKNFSMTATKQAVDITDFSPAGNLSDYLTVLEVDKDGKGGYEKDDADNYGMIILQKNQDGSYTLFTNLNSGNILDLIQLTSVLASVNYYASAVAGTVMERKDDTSNQKAAVAGAVSMLFNDSITRAIIGKNAKITTNGDATIKATSEANTRLLGGALSSSGAKAGIGVNVATVKQKDHVEAVIGDAAVIKADCFRVLSESAADLQAITAAAVNANGTSVGGALNVVINDTGAESNVGNGANILTSGDVEIRSDVKSNVTLGSVTVSISGGQDKGASVGAIVSVATNASAAEAILGNNVSVTSDGALRISAQNREQVISVLAAVARSGNGGAGAGTVSVLTTDARTIASIGEKAKLTAKNDIVICADSQAKLIDVMLAAAASTDAPAVGATIMVNVFNRETGASIGSKAVVVSKLGNVLVQADSDETAIIISVAGAAASQNAISGNIQVNVGNSKTYAAIGDDATIKAWDSIGVTANHDGTVIAVSPSISYGSGSAAVGATVQTNVLGSRVEATIGQRANLIAYAQPSATNGVQTTNRETKRKGIILSAFAEDLVVAGGIAATAGQTAVAGVVETLVNKTIVLARLGANAIVKAGFQSGDTVDAAFSGNTATEQEGELSAEADAHSKLYLFGGAFSASSKDGVGATVLTLVNTKSVNAELLLSNETPSHVNGKVNAIATAKDFVALVSVNFGVSNNTAVNAGGNVLIFQNAVNAQLSGKLIASGNVTVQADSTTNLINGIASVSGSLANPAVSGAALVTYFQGSTTASVGAGSDIDALALNVLATSTANINSDGVGLTASFGSAAVSGIVNIIVTSTNTQAYVGSGSKIVAETVTVTATDNYDLLAVAASLAGGSNGVGVTAVVTVAKNTVLAYIGNGSVVQCDNLTVKAISNRNIRNYAGTAAVGGTAGVGVTVMVAVIGGKLDQDSANGIAKGFKADDFMTGIQTSAPNAAKEYLDTVNLSADLTPDGSKPSDTTVGNKVQRKDENGNLLYLDDEGKETTTDTGKPSMELVYSGTDGYRSDDFDKQYTSGTNPGENFPEDATNTQGSNLGLAKPEAESTNVIQAYIGEGCNITVSGATLVEANEKLNVDIVTASVGVSGTAGCGVGVAVVVAYSNVLAEVQTGAVLNCGNITVHAVSGGDGSIADDKASEILHDEDVKIDAQTKGSSIRAIAISIGVAGTGGASPSVAVVNMASSAIARMNGVSGNAGILTVKAEMLYPNVLAITGSVGAGGMAGISASVAVVTFNSNTEAEITGNTKLTASQLNVQTIVDNTAKTYAMGLAGGTVGVNGGVAVVTNRSTTKTTVGNGVYEITGNVNVTSNVNTNAESFIIGVGLGGVGVNLNAAVVNQDAEILTQILGNTASSLTSTGNVTVSNDITATAKSSVYAVVAGGVGVNANVLLVFNNMEAKAQVSNMPFTVTGNLIISAGMNANSQASVASGTVGGVAVGVSTSYVGLNAENLALLNILQGAKASAASIRVYAGNANKQNSFNATASTVGGQIGGFSGALNAAVADINASNQAKIDSAGILSGSVDVQANAAAAALAEIHFVSAGATNIAAATAVSVLRLDQLAEAKISELNNCGSFHVSSALNDGSKVTPSHAKLVTANGGLYNASANVAVAYSLSKSVANAILHNGSISDNITVNASGAADAKSETVAVSGGAFTGSVAVNVAYAKGEFQSLFRIGNQVSANSATVQTVYTTNATADLTPSATKLSLGSFDVNLAIARVAAKASATLEGTGMLVLAGNLLVKADGSNSRALANINGATVTIEGISFGVNVADSQMALEQNVYVRNIQVDTDGRIEIYSNVNNLNSTAETGANGGIGITLAESKANSANANVSAVNHILLKDVKITATERVTIEANSNNLVVNAIAKALDFTLSGISAAVTTTEAKVTKFNTGVDMENANISGYQVYAVAYAKGSHVEAQSSVPSFSGSIIGLQNILASAKILEKLTQVIVDSRTNLSTVSDLMLNAFADAALEAGSARHTTSTTVGIVTVTDYQFTIDVTKIRTEVQFAGKMNVGTNARLYANDMITGNITMNSSTIGFFDGGMSVARINVQNQTAAVNVAGDITAGLSIGIEAKADQKLSALVDTSSTDFSGTGEATADVTLYRNALVDIDGNLVAHGGHISIKALAGTHSSNNKVIDLNLKMSVDTWVDGASYPAGTGTLVSNVQVNVKEGSLIQALDAHNDDGFIDIRAKSEGYVQVYVYRYVDKGVGGNSAFATADVNETIKVNIGGSEKTRILGRDVEIRAFSELDVRSIAYAWSNVLTGVTDPKATVIFREDIDTIIRSAEISAKNYMLIVAYLSNTYVQGHSIAKKDWAADISRPTVNIKGNVYGDVTIDKNTILRAYELRVSTFQPAGGNGLTIERLAEGYHGNKLDKTYEHTVFSTSSDNANKYYRTAEWNTFSREVKFLSGAYDPSIQDENNVYYSGQLTWNADYQSNAPSPGGKTEIYLGYGASRIEVIIESNGQVKINGLSSSVKQEDLVKLQDGVYIVDGSKLLGTSSAGVYRFSFDTIPNGGANELNELVKNNVALGELTVVNKTQYSLQLNNVNQPAAMSNTELKVTQNNSSSHLILNGGGNFSTGKITVDMDGGNLILRNGAQIDARNILIRGVHAIVDEKRTDGKVVITNSNYNTRNDSSIEIAVEDPLNLVLKTFNTRYTINRIQTKGNLILEVVNPFGDRMPVLLGELISGGDVTANIPYSVESKDQGLVNITGNSITLNVGGSVGTSYRHLCIDSSANQKGVVNVTGNGGIYLKEADGDLYIDEIWNVGYGTIAIWTQNGSIYAAPEDLTDNSTDLIEMVDTYILKYAEYGVLEGDAYDMVQILLQYLADLHRIREALVANGEAVLETVKKEIDILRDVNSVEAALAKIDKELRDIGGAEYQNPETGKNLMDGALENEHAFTDEVNRLATDKDGSIGGLLGAGIVLWRNAHLESEKYLQDAIGHLLNLLTYSVNISGNGDLQLHVQSSTGTANISGAVDSLSIAMGGKVTITSAQNTVLKDVYLESYTALKLDPIVATDVIDLYSLNGIYAATRSNRVLLDADKLVLHSLLSGDLGTANQALILNTNLLNALGNYVYLENRKDLVVDILVALEDLYLTVRGNLNDQGGDDKLVNGICGNGVTLKVSGDIGKQGKNVTVASEKYLNITAQNLYLFTDGDILVGTIRADGMVSIDANEGSIQNAEQGTGIWCESMRLDAYGMIGTDDSPLLIHSNSVYTSTGGGLVKKRLLFSAPKTEMEEEEEPTLMANSFLYGENVKIVPVVVNQKDEPVWNVEQTTGMATDSVTEVTCSNTGIRITGTVSGGAVLNVSDVSEHTDCEVCQMLMENHQYKGRIFVNLELTGNYAGKLLVQIPATEALAELEGQEIVILTCGDGVVWAIRGIVINGFITFHTEELGPFLILGDPAQLDLTEDGTQILLDQQIHPFGGWL